MRSSLVALLLLASALAASAQQRGYGAPSSVSFTASSAESNPESFAIDGFDPDSFDFDALKDDDFGIIDDRAPSKPSAQREEENENEAAELDEAAGWSIFKKKPAKPAGPEAPTLAGQRIRKIVLLVLENRSFDHVAGYFKYNPEIRGLSGKEYNDVTFADGATERFYATGDAQTCIMDDPGHGIDAVTEQLYGDRTTRNSAPYKTPSMTGFARNMANDIVRNSTELLRISQCMKSFGDPDKEIPVMHMLAREFALFDMWFCSFPGSTMPNRMFVHSATSHGEISTKGERYIKGYPQRTFYNALSENGYTWKNYFKDIPSLLVMSKNRKLSYLDQYRPFSQFVKDARKGKLPDFSFLDPHFGTLPGTKGKQDDGHPAGGLYKAEKYLKEVYDALRGSPTWNETLFIVTFDEHGGFHDHVPPPVAGIPSPDGRLGSNGFTFDRLGVRVPTFMVSPWLPRSLVVHDPPVAQRPDARFSQYDHTSIIATVRKMWGLRDAELTDRDRWAGTFEHVFEHLDRPRGDAPKTAPAPREVPKGEPGCPQWNPSSGYVSAIKVLKAVAKRFFGA